MMLWSKTYTKVQPWGHFMCAEMSLYIQSLSVSLTGVICVFLCHVCLLCLSLSLSLISELDGSHCKCKYLTKPGTSKWTIHNSNLLVNIDFL